LESFLPIIQFLLTEFILENFELTSIDRREGVFQVHIEEKNADQQDLERKNLLSKGFYLPSLSRTSPFGATRSSSASAVRRTKRRRCLNTKTGKIVYRDWTIARLFLKAFPAAKAFFVHFIKSLPIIRIIDREEVTHLATGALIQKDAIEFCTLAHNTYPFA
jgi:hypothetical protein